MEVDVDGRLVKPWVTGFIDCATNVVTGTAVTPGSPSRESILAALRAAISVDDPYGPAGGLPQMVRVDRGKDFLSNTVAAACAVFAVKVGDLPGYTPHLKGSVETLNGAAKSMFFAGLPGTRRRRGWRTVSRRIRTLRRCATRRSSTSCCRGCAGGTTTRWMPWTGVPRCRRGATIRHR